MAARARLGPFQGPAPHARRSRSRSGVIAASAREETGVGHSSTAFLLAKCQQLQFRLC